MVVRTVGKKGLALGDMLPIAIGFVLLGATIAIGATVLSQMATNTFTTATALCEPVVFTANNTYASLSHPYIKSIDYMYNQSECGGVAPNGLIKSANYSWTDRQVKFTASGGAGWDPMDNGTKFVNYTYFTGAPIQIVQNSTTGMGSLSGWIPIIAIVVAASVVIAILMGSFRLRFE